MRRVFSIASIILGLAALAAGLWGVMQKSALGFTALLTVGGVPPEGVTGLAAFSYRYGLLTVVAGVLLLILGVLLFVVGRENDQVDYETSDPAAMPDRHAIKTRVKGLLFKSWGSPLLAVLYLLLPTVACVALIHVFLRPLGIIWDSVREQAQSVLIPGASGMDMLLSVLMFEMDWMPFVYALPGLALLVAVSILITQPMLVSFSGYFIRKLRGKQPAPQEVFHVFSPTYGRALGGMAYRALWSFLWTLAAVGVPALLIFGAFYSTTAFPDFTAAIGLTGQLWLLGGALGGGAVWLIVFAFVLINRALAYAMVPCVLAGQPRLPARQAVRASRKLMRGQKRHVIGLWLSFLQFYLPAIIAGLLLLVLTLLGRLIALPAALTQWVPIVLYVVMGVNQLVIFYVAPYAYASFHAFYLERKRYALQEGEVRPEWLGAKKSPEQRERAEMV